MPENIRNAPATDFRFTIRGLMLLVVFVALGAMVVRQDLSRWHNGLLVVAVCWILLGIVNQVRDLTNSWRLPGNSSWSARGTLLIAIARRTLVALVLMGYLLWLGFHPPSMHSEWYTRQMSWLGWGMADCVFVLAIMSAMLFRSPSRDFIRSRWLRISRDVLIGIVGCVWLFYLYRNRLFIHELVQRAIRGWLSGLPFAGISGSLMSGNAHDQWVRASLASAMIAGIAIVATFVCMNRLIAGWSRNGRSQLSWLVLLGASLGIAAWEIVWAATSGLPSVEFYFGEAIERPAAINLFTGGIILLLFTTEATLRLGQVEDQATGREIQWQFRPEAYHHERQAALALLVVAITGGMVTDILWRGEEYGIVEFGPTWWQTVRSSVPLLMLDSATILKVACVLLAVHVFWWQRSSTQLAEEPMPLIVFPKFCVLWLSILGTTVLTIATLLWLYYTVCLMPR